MFHFLVASLQVDQTPTNKLTIGVNKDTHVVTPLTHTCLHDETNVRLDPVEGVYVGQKSAASRWAWLDLQAPSNVVDAQKPQLVQPAHASLGQNLAATEAQLLTPPMLWPSVKTSLSCCGLAALASLSYGFIGRPIRWSSVAGIAGMYGSAGGVTQLNALFELRQQLNDVRKLLQWGERHADSPTTQGSLADLTELRRHLTDASFGKPAEAALAYIASNFPDQACANAELKALLLPIGSIADEQTTRRQQEERRAVPRTR